jgi:hypothetical protein
MALAPAAASLAPPFATSGLNLDHLAFLLILVAFSVVPILIGRRSKSEGQAPTAALVGPPGGPAINDEATRTALARYRLAAWRWAGVGVALTGLAALIVADARWFEVGIAVGGAGIVMLAGAAAMLQRVIRWRALLAQEPWRAFRAQHLRLKPDRANAGLVLTPVDARDGASQAVLRLDAMSWRQNRLDDDSVVWMCGDPNARVIVTSPKTRALFAASPPRGYLGRKFMSAHSAELASLDASLPGDGTTTSGPMRRGRILALALAPWLVLLPVIALTNTTVRGWLHIGSSLPSCEAAGISTAPHREGKCALVSGLFSSTVYSVVDRDQTLQMPEYQARLLASRFPAGRVNGGYKPYYPDGRGLFASYEIRITNPRSTPLRFGEAAPITTSPSYPRHPRVALLIPPSLTSSSRGSAEVLRFAELINGRDTPTPSIGLVRLIPGHGSITGWATFVAPAWSGGLLDARPADLDLYRVDNDPDYVGQIRLWK